MNWKYRILMLSIFGALIAGCSNLTLFHNPDNGRVDPGAMLPPIKAASDSVGVEIFFIRRSVTNADSAKALWENVSELPFPEQTRHQMRINGFQFGVLGSAQTSALVDMLNLVNPGSHAHVDSWENAIQFDKDEKVMCRYVELNAGQPAEALASDIYDNLTFLLKKDDGSIGGESFQQAQCVFRIISSTRPDNAIDLTILPEIQHGPQRPQYVYEQGIVKMEYGRSRKTFESLQMKVKLKPGEMIVLSCQPEQTASLGSQFFTDASIRGDYQKIMIIRLARLRSDPLFPESGVKKSDCVNEPIVNVEAPETIDPVILDLDPKEEGKEEDDEAVDSRQ